VESPRVIRLPLAEPASTSDVLEEVNGSIDLVAAGIARRMVIAGLPGVEAVAAGALAHAQASHVGFSLSRDETGTVTVLIGPREA
jgi:hypothetical protein